MSSRPRQIALLLTAILIGVGVMRQEPTAFLVAAVVATAGLLFPPRKQTAWLITLPVLALGWWVSHDPRNSTARERVILGERDDSVEREHVARYEFARPYVAGKRVADIACGAGYGMRILRETAASVEGYDREALGQRYIIDLEKQSWPEQYDVIVSFETIEHLANPEFFIENAARSAPELILSTPVGEKPGENPYHKQAWTAQQVKALLERFYHCEYRCQAGERIGPDRAPCESASLLAICSQR